MSSQVAQLSDVEWEAVRLYLAHKLVPRASGWSPSTFTQAFRAVFPGYYALVDADGFDPDGYGLNGSLRPTAGCTCVACTASRAAMGGTPSTPAPRPELTADQWAAFQAYVEDLLVPMAREGNEYGSWCQAFGRAMWAAFPEGPRAWRDRQATLTRGRTLPDEVEVPVGVSPCDGWTDAEGEGPERRPGEYDEDDD